MAKTFIARWSGCIVAGAITGLSVWLAYAVLATGAAAFFEAEGNGVEAMRWRPTSSAALALESESLANQDERSAADKVARRALARSPLRADALRVLGFSASTAGRNDEAEHLLNRATHTNPRDDEVQGWLLQDALAQADYYRAFMHADALMRRSVAARVPLAFTITNLLGNDQARSALVGRLATNPPWREDLLSIIAQQGTYAEVAALFGALRPTRFPITDAEAEPFFRRMEAAQRFGDMKTVFDALVNPLNSPKDLIYDGAFTGRAGPAPLNWQAVPVVGGSARWKRDDGTPLGRLIVRHDGFSSSGPLLRQLIYLPPGSYELSGRALVDDPIAASRFTLQITCSSRVKLVSLVLLGTPRAWVTSHADFSVPPADCATQWLQVVPITGERRETTEMSIDDIVVRHVAVPRAAELSQAATTL